MTQNMRRGFTMIELVFVIVIIGILAAVALPRFTGISDDAHVSKLQAFTGTLNRTTGPSKWSNLQRRYPGANGSFQDSTVSSDTNMTQVIVGQDVQSIPSEFNAGAGYVAGPPKALDLTKCAPAGTAVPNVGDATPTTGVLATTVTLGTDTYVLGCIDSGLNASPVFWLGVQGGKVITK